jgi:hypothetical protein
VYNPATTASLDFSKVLAENVRLSKERAELLKDGQEVLTYVSVLPTRRLNIF